MEQNLPAKHFTPFFLRALSLSCVIIWSFNQIPPVISLALATNWISTEVCYGLQDYQERKRLFRETAESALNKGTTMHPLE